MPHAAAVPTAWKQLAATFVLGTDRAGAQAVKVDGAVAELIAALPPNDSIARQLDAAACLSVFMRAGASFEAPRAGSAPCTDCGLRQPSLVASQLLASVLELGLPELLAEWCGLAGAARVRIADELLPQVLNRMADSPDAVYTAAVIQTLGSRGRWLVEQNSTWKAALVALDDPESAMESGSTIERVRALRLLRLKDAAHARELLQSRLDGDAEERARLIAVLAHGLNAADESFLEAVLDDKAAGVRRAAADLLARLPQSAYGRRMAGRMPKLATVSRGRAKLLRKGKVTLNVNLPEPGDKDLTRDAVEFKAKGKLGTKAYSLSQMVGAVPLDHWTGSADASPEEIIAATMKTEWSEPLLLGWTLASVRQHDAVWAQAIISEYFQQPGVEPTQEAQQLLPQLVDILEVADREQSAESMLAKAGAWSGPLLDRFLASCDEEWSRSLSEAALASLRKHIAKTRGAFDESLRRLVAQRFAVSFDPGLADEFAAGWPTEADWWPRWLGDLVDQTARILQLRRDMHRELTK